MNNRKDKLEALGKLLDIMDELRIKCPWDREQTFESIRNNTIEETYELADAILKGDMEHTKKELGDLLLHIVFYAKMGSETGHFDIKDVADSISEKLIFRHPHVFGDMKISSSDAQIENWERIKKREKGDERKSALSGIPSHLPALLRAQKITEKASRVGFDWKHVDQVVAKVMEELQEFEEALETGNNELMEAELGDLLFAIVNLGRFLSINPEEALRKTITRFQKRFGYVETRLTAQGQQINSTTLEEMDRLWDEAKEDEKSVGQHTPQKI